MTTGTTAQTLDDRVRQIIMKHDLCVASGTAPDGLIDGILMFGLNGLVEFTDSGLCRFPLRAIEEGSPLRAWLRISRYTGISVPWALMFLDRQSGALVRLVGVARLVAGSDVPFPERTESLIVELTPLLVTNQPPGPPTSDASHVPPTTAAGTTDGSLTSFGGEAGQGTHRTGQGLPHHRHGGISLPQRRGRSTADPSSRNRFRSSPDACAGFRGGRTMQCMCGLMPPASGRVKAATKRMKPAS